MLLASTVVIASPFAFTYLPIMHDLFATRPVAFADSVLIVGVGSLAMVLPEAEKRLLHRMGVQKTY